MLDIVVTTRNDDHGGNLLHRLATFVDALDGARRRYDWGVELTIVEWNPPDDRLTLDAALNLPDWVRLIRVPLNVHRRFENADIIPIFFHIGQNVGIRRTRGEWVLCTSQDVVLSDRLARFLALGNLDRGAFYRATRMDTDVRRVPRRGVEAELFLAQRVISARAYQQKQTLHTRSCGDFILMHRDAWVWLQGFPELELFGTYLDGYVLHAVLACGLAQVALDPTRCLYHIAHGAQTQQKLKREKPPHLNYTSEYRPLCRAMLKQGRIFTVNDDDLGLWGDPDVVEVVRE